MIVDANRAAPWLRIARAELGVRNFPAGSSNPRITEYHAGTNIAGYDDKANWCSSFVHWTLARAGIAGIAGTASALARSWRTWGDALDAPRIGCIAVLWREDPQGWKGHVGFFLRADGDEVVLLGGNQLDSVREHRYPRDQVLAYRWPAGQA
ncbi:MAG: TIGR02594 family protein [Pseudomonadota bacterium]|nr:TIGR02594 family protein [Pseudomonadota bacterium]